MNQLVFIIFLTYRYSNYNFLFLLKGVFGGRDEITERKFEMQKKKKLEQILCEKNKLKDAIAAMRSKIDSRKKKGLKRFKCGREFNWWYKSYCCYVTV